MVKIIGEFIGIIYIYLAIINLTDFKITKKELVAVMSITQLMTFPIYINWRFLSVIPVNIIAMIFLNKKSNKLVISIILPLTSTIIAVISDYIVSFFRMFIIGIGFNIMLKDCITSTVCFIADCIVIFIISKVLGIIINKRIKLSQMELKGKLGFLTVSSLLLTLIIFYSNIILGSNDGFTTEIIELNGILFFIYFILLLIIMYILIRNITKELEFKNKQNQFENLKEYTTNLEKLYTEMRSFRHDYINILSSIIGYIENKDMDGLEVYFNNKIIPLGKGIESNNFKIGNLKNVKILELKGILSSKLMHAQELGVDVFIDVMETIERIDMDVVDICRIVGILIDNSVEAALTCAKPYLKVALINKNKSTMIVFINSCPENTPPIYKLFQAGFSTKGSNRGLGLSNLKEVIKNYNNVYLDTQIENGEFIQNLEVWNV